MSWQASQWAVAQKTGSASAKAVLMVLAEAARDDTCVLSQTAIAERAELKRRAVVSAMHALEVGGFIHRQRRGNEFGHRTSDRIELNRRAADVVALSAPDAPSPSADNAPGEPIPMCTKGPAYVHLKTSLGAADAQEPVFTVSKYVERAKPGRRKPETPIQDGFPDAAAIAAAAEMYRREGWNIDASAQAEAFRHHAQTHDRRVRDWAAAFRMWASKATKMPGALRTVVQPQTAEPIVDWDHRVAAYRLNSFWQADDWGPKPGKPGCLASASALAAHGFHAVLVPMQGAGSAA